MRPAARWAPSAKTAPPGTSSAARSRTPLPAPACSAPRPPPRRAPSPPKSSPSPSTPPPPTPPAPPPASGPFAAEIEPVPVKTRAGQTLVSIDEGPGKIRLEKIATLKPAFKKGGTITAASSSSINDGAAALVLLRASSAQKLGCQPLARIVSHATHAQAPQWFATAPLGAAQKALAKAGWAVGDVQLWEINEAFAVVPMALMKELNLAHEQVNVNGGACALGHPIGASGARIVVTLIHALKARVLRRGLATLCIGGGEATALAVESM